ncbi:MAG: diphthine--ammonia ligase [Candidatus Omnitrophota bacterium]
MSQKHRKAFVSWSGGKDSALACYNAIKNDGIEIAYLLNMLSENGTHSRSHHLSVAVLKAQAEAMGIPIVQRQARWGDYEEEFKKALAVFKEEGVQTGVFGDIDVQEHRDWVERVCSESGLNAILPLWQRSREPLMGEFIAAGFKAVIVAVNPARNRLPRAAVDVVNSKELGLKEHGISNGVKLECMGSVWLGRQLDRQFVEDMKRLPQVDLCGENGEYHTFVYDGPIFKVPVAFSAGDKMHTQTHSFLDIVLKER